MDGAADEPLDELDGNTILQEANVPNADYISANGRLGLVNTVPNGFSPGSDVALMSLLGYAPLAYYTGRAPLEAAALNVKTDPQDWIFRCNLVTIADGKMLDYSAGHIDNQQAANLINDLNDYLGNDEITFYPGVSYRHLMVCRGSAYDGKIAPPHDILDQEVAKYMPRGRLGKKLCDIMEKAAEFLSHHEVNKVRSDLGENPAGHIWLWGQGRRPQMDRFSQRFGKSAAVITAVDLLRGIGKLIGMKSIDVEGATGYFDTNYAGKGAAALEALKQYDLVVAHVEAPDEAGHGGLIDKKIEAVEQIDKHLVGPILEYFKRGADDWRIMVSPDHPTPVKLRTHTADPVPFTMAGSRISEHLQLSFNESNAARTGLKIDKGHELMEYFLKM